MDLLILEQGAQAGHLHGDTQNVAGCLMGPPSEGLPGGGEGVPSLGKGALLDPLSAVAPPGWTR